MSKIVGGSLEAETPRAHLSPAGQVWCVSEKACNMGHRRHQGETHGGWTPDSLVKQGVGVFFSAKMVYI